MSFEPSWNVKKQVGNRSHIGTAPDPAHSVSTPHDTWSGTNGPIESWMSQSDYPGAGSLVLEPYTAYADSAGGGGPIDATPIDHTTGLGSGAGLDARESQAQNASWHAVEENATAARRWTAPTDSDGVQHVFRQQEQPSPGIAGSPANVMMQARTNYDAYPEGRIMGHRTYRWRDRTFDRRTYTPDHWMQYTPNAFTAPDVPAGDGPYTSSAPQQGHVNVLMEKAPQLRRVPTSWSDPVVTDPTSTPGFSEAPLDVWGQ